MEFLEKGGAKAHDLSENEKMEINQKIDATEKRIKSQISPIRKCKLMRYRTRYNSKLAKFRLHVDKIYSG